MLRELMIKMADWFDRRAEWFRKRAPEEENHGLIKVPQESLDLLPETLRLFNNIEESCNPGTDGGWKRMTLLSLMMKKYPTAKKFHISFAIELARLEQEKEQEKEK